MPLDLPPEFQERIVCSITAAIKYEVPANIVLAVAEKEGGKPGQWVKNSNGTQDVGVMQFNTAYLAELLPKYGITADDVAQAGCYAYDLAAWRLRGHLRNDTGDVWTRAANYHSRTPEYNTPYRADLMRKAAKWGAWIEARFVTYDATKPGRVSTIAATTTTAVTPVESVATVAQATATATAAPPVQVVKVSVPQPRYNEAAARALAAVYGPSRTLKQGNALMLAGAMDKNNK